VSYSSLPDDYIPVIEAASQLAFGDNDYEKHYRRVEVWKESGIPLENVAEIKRRRQEEFGGNEIPEWAYPEFFQELDDLGRTKSYRLECPEIEQELNRLHRCAAEGTITIIARPRAVPTWSKLCTPPLELEYQEVPARVFKHNKWVFLPYDPFTITKPFDRAAKEGGSYAGRWYYPAVARSDVDRLQAEGPGSQTAPPETHSDMAVRPAAGTRQAEASLPKYKLVSDVLLELIPDGAGFSDSARYLGFWISAVQHEWKEGNVDMLRRVPGQEQPTRIASLGRNITIDLDDRTSSIRCVIRSDASFDGDQFEDPLITDQHLDYLKRKYRSANWTDTLATPAESRPGPRPELSDSITNKMLDDLRSGRETPEGLRGLKLEALSAQYGGSKNTANKARKQALARFSEFQN
jgi:hypothetical protein